MQTCNKEEASTNMQPCINVEANNVEPSSMQACNNIEVPSSMRTLDNEVPTRSSRRPKGTGRKKIEIKKIENKLSLKVAFSKRRKGLFKKAEEICKLCDAEIAIIVFSTKGRLFSYGYPSVEHVVNRFLSENRDELGAVSPVEETEEAKMEEEEQTKEQEEQPLVAGKGEFWFDESIENLDVEKLEEYAANLECLRKNLSMRLEELILRRTSEIDFLGKFGA